jgi:hypothetical protein
MRPIGANACNVQGLVVGTDFSASTRRLITPHNAVSIVQALYEAGAASAGAGSGNEPQQLTPQIYQASLEYPLNTTSYRMSVNGNDTWVVTPGTNGKMTDPLGVFVPAGATFAITTFARIPKFPTGQSASAVSGGSLTPSTTYYYKLTTIDNGVESGPTAEFSATTGSSGTLAILISWTNATYGDSVRIYRGTSSGNEQFYAEVKMPGTTFVDLGYLSQVASITPPSGNGTLLATNYLQTGESGNVQSTSAGAGTNQTGTTGAITGRAGPSSSYGVGPSLVLGNDVISVAVAGDGDSIMFGTSINTLTADTLGRDFGNWFCKGCITAGLNFYNHSIGGSKIGPYFDGTRIVRNRARKFEFADVIVSDLATNDLAASVGWTTIAANHLARGKMFRKAGKKYIITTVFPRVTMTDAGLTIGAQSAFAAEAQRQNYNNWVRGGCQVDGSNSPVISGGTPSPDIWMTFDMAAAAEVNASNVLTANGGYWLIPTSAYGSYTLTGTPTTTSLAVSGTPFPVPSAASSNPGLATYSIKMTSGAASGQTAVISTNTNSTLTLYSNGSTSLTGLAVVGLTVAPSAGDTFDIYQAYCVDGVHPTKSIHDTVAANFATPLASVAALEAA